MSQPLQDVASWVRVLLVAPRGLLCAMSWLQARQLGSHQGASNLRGGIPCITHHQPPCDPMMRGSNMLHSRALHCAPEHSPEHFDIANIYRMFVPNTDFPTKPSLL